MKILDVTVDWMEGWGNAPRIVLMLAGEPNIKALRYEVKDNTYRAIDKDGYVSFFAWRGPGNEGGYGGREFPITMTTGFEVILKGPWSSNSDSVNRVFNDGKHVMEVSYSIYDQSPHRKYGRYAGAFLVDALVKWLNDHPEKDFYLAWVQTHYGKYVQAVHKLNGLKNKSETILEELTCA